jgi:hypothetical protein
LTEEPASLGEPLAASERRRWVGLEALRYGEQPPNEAFQPPLTHHSLVLLLRTPKESEFHCDGVNRVVPPRAGSILVVPAGSPARWRWSSHTDSLHLTPLGRRLQSRAMKWSDSRSPTSIDTASTRVVTAGGGYYSCVVQIETHFSLAFARPDSRCQRLGVIITKHRRLSQRGVP